MHRLGDDELAQHGTDPSAAVAHAGERRAARPLELDVASATVPVHDFTEEDGPAVAELGIPAAELVPGIGLRERVGAPGHRIAGEDGEPLGRKERRGVEPKLLGQRLVEREEPRRGHGDRGLSDVEAVRQAGVAVVEGNVQGHGADIGFQAGRSKRAAHRFNAWDGSPIRRSAT